MSEFEEESGRLGEMAEKLEVLERRVRKRKRSESDSESTDSDSGAERSSRSRNSKKSKKSKSRRKERKGRWEERRISAKKRQWKAKSQEEQARVLEMALEPLGRARTRAEDKGERGVVKDIRKGEEVLQDRLKLLLFADADGWGAANIYADAVEVGSDSEDERRMRKATKEAKASVKRGSEGGGKPFRQGRAATASVAAAISSAGAGQQAPTGQPAMPREVVCWSCGGKGHLQSNCQTAKQPNSRSDSRLGPEQAVCDEVRPEATALPSDKFCLLSDYDEEMYSASVCSDGEWVMEGEEG